MRTVLIAGGVLLLILLIVASLVAVQSVTAPMWFAGIDQGAAARIQRGAAVDVVRPGITRREIVELLGSREFDTLTQIIETRNQRALADPNEEWELGRVIDAFDIADDSLGPVFEDWIHASSESYAPLLASAQYRFTMAFLQRGERNALNTTPEQLEGMTEQLRLLANDVAASLRKDPNLSEAYRLLINASRAGGTQRGCGLAAEQGLAIMPASFRIRTALVGCRLPRWGGSYKLVQAVADAADPFVGENPLLAALHGFVEWDRGRLAEGDTALAHFTRALDYGANAGFYDSRARLHLSADRFGEALKDIDAALLIAPDTPDYLIRRMYALLGLGRNDEILSIVDLIETIDPMNTDLPGFKAYALEVAAVEGYDLQQESKSGESIERLTAGIALNGGDAQAYYWRGRAYLQAGDHDKALADFGKAIRLDPAHFESYRNIDYIFARRGNWAQVISMWDDYLARKPDDGKAVFERAGAYRHSGNQALAMADARKACELGVQQACAVLR